jgi:basic membrane lipoprotein Med (substrate-binding protein (PBP1-ABC) superfamily)
VPNSHATGVDVGGLSASWQKSWNEEDKIKRTQGGDVLALSAFGISTLSNPVARKQLVKDMWDSGADVIVSSTGTRVTR